MNKVVWLDLIASFIGFWPKYSLHCTCKGLTTTWSAFAWLVGCLLWWMDGYLVGCLVARCFGSVVHWGSRITWFGFCLRRDRVGSPSLLLTLTPGDLMMSVLSAWYLLLPELSLSVLATFASLTLKLPLSFNLGWSSLTAGHFLVLLSSGWLNEKA